MDGEQEENGRAYNIKMVESIRTDAAQTKFTILERAMKLEGFVSCIPKVHI